MKIAVNCRLLVPDKMDGIGRFTYESLQRISRQNKNCDFTFIFDRKISEGSFNFSENVKVVSLSPQARHPILWIIWFEFRLRKFINREKFDLFLSPEGWIPPKLNCKSLGVMHDLNFVHHPENIIFSHRKYLQHFFPKYAHRSDRIATVSEYSKQDISKSYGVKSNHIDVVYNGANKIFQAILEEQQEKIRLKHSNGNPFFVFIGTLHPRKNIEHLLKAFELFKSKKKTNLQLLIVGNKKWWPQSLENIFQQMSYKSDVVFVGRLEDDELAKVLGSAEALTYLPYFEGFGIPILEAFQAEIAVITSNVTSMPEVAEDAALLCNPKNAEEIAEAMVTIYEDKELRKSLIQKGRARAKFFSWDKTAQLLWESIEKVLE